MLAFYLNCKTKKKAYFLILIDAKKSKEEIWDILIDIDDYDEEDIANNNEEILNDIK